MSGEPIDIHRNKIITVYGAPRRYDLATMMTVSVFFALLFSFLRMLEAEPWFIATLSTFIAFVGLSQAALFGGRAPRRSSLVAGMVLGPIVVLLEAYWEKYPVDFSTLFLAAVWYAPIGYVLGALVGGIFLVSDYVRRLGKRWRRDGCP